jgi:hypothetical protein
MLPAGPLVTTCRLRILHRIVTNQIWRYKHIALELQLPVQSVPITTKVVKSNPFHSEVYSIQQYVTFMWHWLAIGWWFSPGTPVSSTNKTDHHDIAEILLKVALNTIDQTKPNQKQTNNSQMLTCIIFYW